MIQVLEERIKEIRASVKSEGRREYHGNPLAYFREHEKRYSNLDRTSFSLADSGLYGAFSKLGQLDELPIPIKKVGRKPLPQDERERIISTYSVYKGNVSRASRALGYSPHVVSRVWRASGFKIKIGRPKKISA